MTQSLLNQLGQSVMPFHLPSRGKEVEVEEYRGGCPDEILLCSLNHQVRNSTFPFFSTRASAPPSSQPSPFSLQPPSPSPLDHITLLLLMTSEHLQHFLSFPPSPYSTISLILSQIHPLVFPPLPPQEDQPPFSCMIPSLISRLQSQTLLSILIINHIWTIHQDDHSSWRDE